MLVHLEGNIASGKTTLGEALAADPAFTFVPEPVPVWQNDFSTNLLERFYSDMQRWSFTFQIGAFATRLQALMEADANTIIVSERSIACDRYVFAPTLYEQGAMDDLEWEVYCRLWETLTPHAPRPDAILYLRTPAEECLRRLQARRRQEESGVTLAYLQKLEALHDDWLLQHNDAIVLDGMKRWTADEIHALLRQKSAP